MQAPPDSEVLRKATASERRSPRLAALLLASVTIALLQLGCGASAPSSSPSSEPLVEGSGAIVGPQLGAAARVARRFAAGYARYAYSPEPPPVPDATAAVRRSLLAAAARVPESRRLLHPRAGGLTLQPLGRDVLVASVHIVDGRFPSFSVGFTVRRLGARWRVVAISPPE